MNKAYDKIESGTFAEAAFNDNSIYELRSAMMFGADQTDMDTWNLSESEWHEQMEIALAALIEFEDDCESKPCTGRK